MSEKRVVWILGSGFSRSLGGPLLWDFFSRPLEAKLIAALQNVPGPATWPEKFGALIKDLRAIYTGGLEERYEDTAFRRGPWADAEEFLEYVDMANDGVRSAKELVLAALRNSRTSYGAESEKIAALALDVRSYLACATNHFIDSPDVVEKAERWEPYRRWASNLRMQDDVISFNYDVVPEQVCRELTLFTYGDRAEPDRQIRNAKQDGRSLVKVHGSVTQVLRDSKITPGETVAEYNADVWDALRRGDRIAIAGPGPGKLAACKGILRPHWELARDLIARATVLVFAGYRIPETDAFARSQICDAIRRAPNLDRIHLVLGPMRDAHVERLAHLLEWATRGRQGAPVGIVDERLWAQDFLAVFDREQL